MQWVRRPDRSASVDAIMDAAPGAVKRPLFKTARANAAIVAGFFSGSAPRYPRLGGDRKDCGAMSHAARDAQTGKPPRML